MNFITKAFYKLAGLEINGANGETDRLRITDYRHWLLNLLTVFILIIVAMIPIVKYVMLVYEGREITTNQAIIFVVQTVTTTGYGELLPFESYQMTLISIFLMISGVFLIFMIIGSIMTSLIEKRIVPKAPTSTKMHEHVIFTSYNETIDRTIKLIKQHHIPYVVAAQEQQEAVELITKGIHAICANPHHDDGLKRLGIHRARLVVASSEDTQNINITLAISTISKTPVVAVMENNNRAQLAYDAGARQVVILEETLGRQLVDWICADASPTEFLKLIDVDVTPELINQLKPSIIHIGSRSEFKNQTIGDVKIRTATGATVVAIWGPDGGITTPSADTIINESTLIVLGPSDNVDRLASYVGGPGPGEHVILAGAGRVGQEAGKMLNKAGIYPVVIDLLDRPLFFQGKLIVGDTTKPHVLQQARVEEADTIIITLHDDSLNIFTVLASRHLNPNINVVVRAVHLETVERLHQAGANHVLSESLLGSQLLQVAMVEMGVLPRLKGYLIRELLWRSTPVQIQSLAEKHRGNMKIICVVRDDKILQPKADYTLQQNDKIVVMGKEEHVTLLQQQGAVLISSAPYQ